MLPVRLVSKIAPPIYVDFLLCGHQPTRNLFGKLEKNENKNKKMFKKSCSSIDQALHNAIVAEDR
jgi:hypothetical protein